MGKLKYKQVILSIAVFAAIAYVICIAFYAVLPEQTTSVGEKLFHGIQMKVPEISFASFITGLIYWLVIAVIGSSLFVWVYNKLE